MTSDPGDFIGAGGTYSLGPSTHQISVFAGPDSVQFHLEDPADAGDFWDGSFGAPPGQTLAIGTYAGAQRYSFAGSAPGLEIDGRGRGCNMLTGSFTVDAIAFDPNGALRTFIVRFEQHCEGAPAALRGTFEFHAA
jgi:hypothetical protein